MMVYRIICIHSSGRSNSSLARAWKDEVWTFYFLLIERVLFHSYPKWSWIFRLINKLIAIHRSTKYKSTNPSKEKNKSEPLYHSCSLPPLVHFFFIPLGFKHFYFQIDSDFFCIFTTQNGQSLSYYKQLLTPIQNHNAIESAMKWNKHFSFLCILYTWYEKS